VETVGPLEKGKRSVQFEFIDPVYMSNIATPELTCLVFSVSTEGVEGIRVVFVVKNVTSMSRRIILPDRMVTILSEG
jgi:hypothetical protein